MLFKKWLFYHFLNELELIKRVKQNTRNQKEEILLAKTHSKRIYLASYEKLVKIIYNTDMEFELRKEFGDLKVKKQMYFDEKLKTLRYLQNINYENCKIVNINYRKHIITITMNYYPWTLADIFEQDKTLANQLAIEKLPNFLIKTQRMGLVHQDLAYRNIAIDGEFGLHFIDLDAIEYGIWYPHCLNQLFFIDEQLYQKCREDICPPILIYNNNKK